MTAGWTDVPWRLSANRVERFYRGGALLDAFRGLPDAGDTNRPEDWLGSSTAAWTPPGAPATEEGLGWAEVGGERRRVVDLVEADPVSVAGGGAPPGSATTGILVKLLDAASRLPVHAHPDRPFARDHLGSPYGKAEAWIVLGTRRIDGEPAPHVRLGFGRDVSRDELRGWVGGGGRAIRDAMTVRPTKPGDVWLVPPGVPHAIGAGVFLLEVQEPTDFSIVLETAGFPVVEADAHLRLGWETALDAIDRAALSDAAVDGLRGGTWLVPDAPVGRRPLLPTAADAWFGAEAVVAQGGGAVELADDDRFRIGVVTAGAGSVRTRGGALELAVGDAFGLPAATAGAAIETDDRLELIVCAPSGPAGRSIAEDDHARS